MDDLKKSILITAFPVYVMGYLSAYTNIKAQRNKVLTSDSLVARTGRKLIDAALEESLDCLYRVAATMSYPEETLKVYITAMTDAIAESSDEEPPKKETGTEVVEQ